MPWDLVLCEIYWDAIHGPTEDAEGHFLVHKRFSMHVEEVWYNDEDDDFDDDDFTEGLFRHDYNSVAGPFYVNHSYGSDDDDSSSEPYNPVADLSDYYAAVSRQHRHLPHPSLRNYHQIIAQPDYVKLHIAQWFDLPGSGTRVCVLKTFWLSIIQRAWRRVFRARRVGLAALRRRELGFPLRLPGLRGLLVTR